MTDTTQPPAPERKRSPISGTPVPESPAQYTKRTGLTYNKKLDVNRKNAMAQIRDAEILDKMIGVGTTLYNMVVARQNEFVLAAQGDPAKAFAEMARDKATVKLCEAAMHQLDKVAQYGYQKLTRMDYVGDAPTAPVNVENKMMFVLNIGGSDAPGRPVNGAGNGHARELTVDAAPGRDDHDQDHS